MLKLDNTGGLEQHRVDGEPGQQVSEAWIVVSKGLCRNLYDCEGMYRAPNVQKGQRKKDWQWLLLCLVADGGGDNWTESGN